MRVSKIGNKFSQVLLLTLSAVTFLTVHARAEISALEMRQKCRGIEAAGLNGDKVFMDTRKYPDVLTCWGAFSTLHQQSLWFDDETRQTPIFLPGVCSITNRHGQRAVVLVKVFTRYVDEHPQDGGKDFLA